MAICGEDVDRYDIVMGRTPFYRLASWAERKLAEIAELEEKMADR